MERKVSAYLKVIDGAGDHHLVTAELPIDDAASRREVDALIRKWALLHISFGERVIRVEHRQVTLCE